MATVPLELDIRVTEEKILSAVKRIVEAADPLRVIAFGSLARGEFRLTDYASVFRYSAPRELLAAGRPDIRDSVRILREHVIIVSLETQQVIAALPSLNLSA